jgi:hypothetical protein
MSDSIILVQILSQRDVFKLLKTNEIMYICFLIQMFETNLWKRTSKPKSSWSQVEGLVFKFYCSLLSPDIKNILFLLQKQCQSCFAKLKLSFKRNRWKGKHKKVEKTSEGR